MSDGRGHPEDVTGEAPSSSAASPPAGRRARAAVRQRRAARAAQVVSPPPIAVSQTWHAWVPVAWLAAAGQAAAHGRIHRAAIAIGVALAAYAPRDGDGWVRVRATKIGELVGLRHEASVLAQLSAMRDAGLIDVEASPGRSSRYRLRPMVIDTPRASAGGIDDDPPRQRGGESDDAPSTTPSAGAGTPPAPALGVPPAPARDAQRAGAGTPPAPARGASVVCHTDSDTHTPTPPAECVCESASINEAEAIRAALPSSTRDRPVRDRRAIAAAISHERSQPDGATAAEMLAAARETAQLAASGRLGHAPTWPEVWAQEGEYSPIVARLRQEAAVAAAAPPLAPPHDPDHWRRIDRLARLDPRRRAEIVAEVRVERPDLAGRGHDDPEYIAALCAALDRAAPRAAAPTRRATPSTPAKAIA